MSKTVVVRWEGERESREPDQERHNWSYCLTARSAEGIGSGQSKSCFEKSGW